MPSGPTAIGITESEAVLIESVEWEKKMEEKSIMATDGSFAQAHAHDPIIEFSVKGRGDGVPALGAVASGLASVTGGTTIISKIKVSEKNDDFDSFEYSGTNFPSA